MRTSTAICLILALCLPAWLNAYPAAAQEACLARTDHLKTAIAADVRKRQISEAVARNLLPEVEKAENLCKAGKVAEGEKILEGIHKTFGYR